MVLPDNYRELIINIRRLLGKLVVLATIDSPKLWPKNLHCLSDTALLTSDLEVKGFITVKKY